MPRRVVARGRDETANAGELGGFTRLDRGESLRLLASVPVGRLIFTVNVMPTVRPMNVALAAGLILLRTTAESTVARKLHDVIVTFKADELDPATCSGWSVTVIGRATRPGDR
jgi:uncharacterized protein